MSTYPTVTQRNLELTPMQVYWTPVRASVNCTTAVASPGIVGATAHGLVAGNAVKFSTTGALPTGLVAGTTYYVISAGLTANAFEVAATPGGSAINFTGSTSGQSSFVNVTPVDLGATLGNVVISAKYTKAEIKADQFGSTVLDRRVTGMEVTITTELAEVQDFDAWKVVFPHATRLSTGGDAIQMNTNVGDSDSAHASLLQLHPLSKDSNDLDFDYYFPQAIASAESSITYGPTEQARLKIVWNVLPDFTVSPAQFMRYGNISAT